MSILSNNQNIFAQKYNKNKIFIQKKTLIIFNKYLLMFIIIMTGYYINDCINSFLVLRYKCKKQKKFLK